MNTAVTDTSAAPQTAAAAPATTTAPAAAPATSSDWTTGLGDDLRGYVQNKGFKDPGSVVDSYRNLEKLLGAPKERLLKLPEKDDAPEWGEVYQRLGRPEKPEGYKIEGQDEGFVKWAQGTFHELGLTQKQAETLLAKHGEFTQGAQQAMKAQYESKIEQENTQLKTEWGMAYDKNVNIAKRAADGLGLKPEMVDALEQVMGFSGVMKFMQSIGSKLGEDTFVSGQTKNGGFGAMTPDAARDRISALRADPTFVQKYVAGDVNARSEMEKLHQMAYVGENQY